MNPLFEKNETIEDRFHQFHSENPEVFRLFCNLTIGVKRSGYEHYSADAILHRIRWHYSVDLKQKDGGPKINNDYSAMYARMAMDVYPELSGFFKTRRRRSA